jgi:hypothetical protein
LLRVTTHRHYAPRPDGLQRAELTTIVSPPVRAVSGIHHQMARRTGHELLEIQNPCGKDNLLSDSGKR